MKKISVIVICACLLLACAACQGEPGTAEPSSDGSAVEPVLQEASSEPTQTRPASTETVSQSAGAVCACAGFYAHTRDGAGGYAALRETGAGR